MSIDFQGFRELVRNGSKKNAKKEKKDLAVSRDSWFFSARAESAPLNNTTKCPVRLMVRTPPFHGGNRGSNPLRDATLSRECIKRKAHLTVSFFGSTPKFGDRAFCDSLFVSLSALGDDA